MVTKRSHILKQTCSCQPQVCLSMCDLFVTTKHQRVNCAANSYDKQILFTQILVITKKGDHISHSVTHIYLLARMLFLSFSIKYRRELKKSRFWLKSVLCTFCLFICKTVERWLIQIALYSRHLTVSDWKNILDDPNMFFKAKCMC